MIKNKFNEPCEIGRSLPRQDAYEKVTGKTKYAADFYKKEMLWLGVKRALIPHGRIISIETDNALKLDGIRAVLTAKDIRGSNRQGVIRKDQQVLASNIIRHMGEPVALVVAESKESLKNALNKIIVKTELLKPVFSMEEAIKEKAQIIHKEHKGKNILLKGEISKGDIDKGFLNCDVIVEQEFQLPMQEHAYLETETGWAIYKDNLLEITVSTQTPFRDKWEVAEALGIAIEKVRIIAPYCGGAFGGKDGITVQTLLGLAAIHFPETPVKIHYDREESFIAGVKRHPAKVYYKIGAKKNGTLQALYANIRFDTGPYDHLGGVVMALGLEHAGGAYKIPATKLKACAIYTNNPMAGAFRGFGVPQVTAGIEQVIDMLAEKLELSSIEIRKRNIINKGDKNAVGVRMVTSVGIGDCLKTVENHIFWKNRDKWIAEAPVNKKRGVGIACAIHGIGYGPKVPDVANAKIELTENGFFKVYCGVVDMGQGNIPTYLQIAGDILNQNLSAMIPVCPDTNKTLPSGSASASRTTFTFGNALIKAAEILKKRIIDKAADMLMEENIDNMELVKDKVIHLPSSKEISLKKIAQFLNSDEKCVTYRYRMPVSKEQPVNNELLKLHGLPHYIFSFGVHLARVEVDILTGNVSVKNYLVVSDCGRLINPEIFKQQIHGGVAQGIGYALFEDMKVEKGEILTKDFSTYILPTALDIPNIVSETVNRYEKNGPFGMKGAGEVAIDAPLPAIGNAIYNACGIRIKNFPITGEKLLL